MMAPTSHQRRLSGVLGSLSPSAAAASSPEYDCVIIGGGFLGLTALAQLRRDVTTASNLNESLRRQLHTSESKSAEQKATFRSQLARARQRSKVLEEQVLALTAEKRQSWATLTAAPIVTVSTVHDASLGGGRAAAPPRGGGRNAGVEIPSRPQ